MAQFGEIEVGLSSPPDRARLVVDLFIEHQQLAEMNRESDTLQVEIYPRPDGRPWIVDEADLRAALTAAAELLGH